MPLWKMQLTTLYTEESLTGKKHFSTYIQVRFLKTGKGWSGNQHISSMNQFFFSFFPSFSGVLWNYKIPLCTRNASHTDPRSYLLLNNSKQVEEKIRILLWFHVTHAVSRQKKKHASWGSLIFSPPQTNTC